MTSNVTHALTTAAQVAGRAPSIHNTQPWRLVVDGSVLELFADRSRQLTELDHDGHLLLLSCGAALHHAEVTLLAGGWRFEVDRPAGEPLARIRVVGRQQPDPVAGRRLAATQNRRTDRRPVAPEPVPDDAVAAVTAAMRGAGVNVHVLRPEQVVELAADVDRAMRAEGTDDRQRAEVAEWVGGARPAGTGVPGSVIPGEPPRTTVPGRDFGTTGSLPSGPGHDEAAVFGVMYGAGNAATDWLRAGEALSAGWLEAVGNGLVLLPVSAPVENATIHHLLRRMVSGIGNPYLAVRLGTAPVGATVPATPRLPAEQTIEVLR